MSTPRFTLPTKPDTQQQVPMPHWECWSCGQPANHHCGPDDAVEGDVLVCLSCTDPAIFTDTGAVRQPTPEEHAGILADPEYRTFVGVIRAANRRALLKQQEEERGQE